LDSAVNFAEKYDLRVPRYTSYPTAPHFTSTVGGEVYRRWLGELDPAGPLSLYFHIPFCDSMCWFCGCYTKIVNRYEPVQGYLRSLHDEIDLVAAALPATFAARHLHWGGGSPTILTPEDWLGILDHLRHRFAIAADAEVAVELDPRDTTREYVGALAAAGVTRASIGVQDFDADVQAAINRNQPFEVVERVCAWLREYGIDDINLDLMYGLPRQTISRVVAMIDKAHRLRPSRLALFGYAHVPWMKTHQRLIDETELPDAAERWRQFAAASERLRALGYHGVGLDHFARSDDPLARAQQHGVLRRNFQGYTTDAASVLLGFGASAIGSLPQGYVQNVAPLKDYAEAVAAGRLPITRGAALSADDRLRGAVIERLMCDLRVDLGAVCESHGANLAALAGSIERLEPLIADGLVVVDSDHVVMTDHGRPLVRLAAAAFDAYLDQGEKKHSRAM
jgi:oxygen-independent coproporphyrinogen III oxidase